VAAVLCPMLESDPGYAIYKRDFTGGCGLFSFVFKDASEEQRARFVDHLHLFGIGYSWGGYESLALPFDPQPVRSVMEWPRAQWGAGHPLGVRLSIGLEDPRDLIDDLDQAFEAMGDR